MNNTDANLYMAIELHENASLAGEKKLAKLELRHHAGLQHGMSGLPPGCRQQLRHIIVGAVATCTRVCP